MRILLTNDDGIQAKGIEILEQAVKKVYDKAEILIYAPSENCTGAGRSLTFGNGKLVEVEKLEKNWFSVHGTPADCVEIACRLHKLDIVFSGVNHGWNLGQDFYLSGTIQAGLHAVDYFSLPAVALSCDRASLLDGYADTWIEKFIREIRRLNHSKGLLSVNFPKINPDTIPKNVKITKVGGYLAVGPIKPEKKSGKSQWFNLLDPMSELTYTVSVNTDVGAVLKGFISVTKHNGAKFPR
jgi:5'-nucleotidase